MDHNKYDGDVDHLNAYYTDSFPVQIQSGQAGTPNLYSWTEQRMSGAAFLPLEGGRTGQANARELNDINLLSGTPFYARLFYEGILSGEPLYVFQGASGTPASSPCMCCTSGVASGSFICISGYGESVPASLSGSTYVSGVAPIGIVPPSWSGSTPVSGLPPVGLEPGYQSSSIAISGGYLLAGTVPAYLSDAIAISGTNAPYPPIVPRYQSGSIPISGSPVPPIPGVVPPYLSSSVVISGPQGIWPGIVPAYLSSSVAISGPQGIWPGIVPAYVSGSRVVSGMPGIWPGIVPPGWPFLTAISGIPPWPGLAGSDYIAISGYLMPLPSSLSGYTMISGWDIPTVSGSIVISGYGPVQSAYSGYVMVSGSAAPLVSGLSLATNRRSEFTGLTTALPTVLQDVTINAGVHGCVAVKSTSGAFSFSTIISVVDAFGVRGSGDQSLSPGTTTNFNLDSPLGVTTPSTNPPYSRVIVAVKDGTSGVHTGYDVVTSILG